MAEHPARSDAAGEALARLLADPAVWVEARPSLERQVADAVRARVAANARAHARPAPRPRTYVLVTAAAAAVIVAVALVMTFTVRRDRPGRDFAAELTGTASARNARATVAITKNRGGFSVVLRAQGLKRLPPGEFYQAWFENDAGTLVAVGTFSSSDSRVTLWSGVSPNDFPTMSVTVERSDGNQSSSGNRVLTGSIAER